MAQKQEIFTEGNRDNGDPEEGPAGFGQGAGSHAKHDGDLTPRRGGAKLAQKQEIFTEGNRDNEDPEEGQAGFEEGAGSHAKHDGDLTSRRQGAEARSWHRSRKFLQKVTETTETRKKGQPALGRARAATRNMTGI